jgi:hypothetical protein
VSDNILPLALGTAAVMAVVEVPLSQRYPLRYPLSTSTRVAVAAAMGFVAVMVAGHAIRAARGSGRP